MGFDSYLLFALLCFSAVGIGRDYLSIAEGMSKAD